MDKLDKEQMNDTVSMQKRLKMGAWLDGESLTESGSATMTEANSDHGNFEKSSIAHDNK